MVAGNLLKLTSNVVESLLILICKSIIRDGKHIALAQHETGKYAITLKIMYAICFFETKAF